MKRAVIYVRVSSKEQAEEGYSLEAQLNACRRYVETQGWTLIREYVEQGESATTADRTQFNRMGQEVRKGMTQKSPRRWLANGGANRISERAKEPGT